MAKATKKKVAKRSGRKQSGAKAANTTPASSMNEMLSAMGNEYARTADKVLATDVPYYISTGAYAMNAVFSGSIYNGIAAGRIFGIAGESQSGKSYLLCGIAKRFLADNPKGRFLLFDSEAAHTQESIQAWAGDVANRVVHIPVSTMEAFRSQSLKAVDWFISKGAAAPPCFMALDSLGMLTSDSELANSVKDEEKQNTQMGVLGKLSKSIFRQLTLKCAIAKIPCLVLGHTYASLSGPGPQQLAGGTGLRYSSDHIITLSASQEKNVSTGERTGTWMRAKCFKSRKIKAGLDNSIYVDYNTGLDVYSGLDDLALMAGVFKKIGNKIRTAQGAEKFASALSEVDYPKETLDAIDLWVRENYTFGVGAGTTSEEAEDEDALNVDPETGELLENTNNQLTQAMSDNK